MISKIKEIYFSAKEKKSSLINKYLDYHNSKLIMPLIFAGLFYVIAICLALFTKHIFYFFNFMYIGTALGIGLFLNISLKKKYISWARRITQFMIGFYMLVFVGFILRENIQIEGFVLYLFSGIFTGAVLHYIIAKIIGPIVFNRGWCGWACWTAAILDVLPWKDPPRNREKKLEKLPYISFSLSMLVVLLIWFIIIDRNMEHVQKTALYGMIAGNLIYYILGVVLAFILKDNRAFCKYLCPIAVIMKVTARFSLLKIGFYRKRCTECGLCELKCPMNIKHMEYKNKGTRIFSTECILCCTCIDICPEKALNMKFRFDARLPEEQKTSEKSADKTFEENNQGENA